MRQSDFYMIAGRPELLLDVRIVDAEMGIIDLDMRLMTGLATLVASGYGIYRGSQPLHRHHRASRRAEVPEDH